MIITTVTTERALAMSQLPSVPSHSVLTTFDTDSVNSHFIRKLSLREAPEPICHITYTETSCFLVQNHVLSAPALLVHK